MLKISVIGSGDWSKKVINEINNNKNFLIKSIVSRKEKNNYLTNKIKIFKSIHDLFEDNSVDCVYVAALPHVNLDIVKLASSKKIPLILEKPICSSYKQAIEIQKIVENNNMIVIPNISNYFSEIFVKIQDIISQNHKFIKKIYIYEGSNGPIRNDIHPVWDWGFHSLSMLSQIFELSKITNLNQTIIKQDKNKKKIVSKLTFKIERDIDIVFVTGNFFKKKIRKIKIILKNNNYFLANFDKHEFYEKNKLIIKNENTPLTSLLNKFRFCIINKDSHLSKNLLKGSCDSIKIIEKFYRC